MIKNESYHYLYTFYICFLYLELNLNARGSFLSPDGRVTVTLIALDSVLDRLAVLQQNRAYP